MTEAEKLMNAIENARQAMDDLKQVMMISPNMAKKLVSAEIDCPPTVLFLLDTNVPDDQTLVLQGDFKANMLRWYRKDIVKLHTYDELKAMGL